MRLRKLGVLGATAFVAGSAGCASKPVPVTVMGDPVETSALVGEWSGEYASPQTNRSGSIMFRLKSEKDTAFGDIVMIPRTMMQAAVNEGPAPRVAPVPAPGQVLTIRFVRMEGDRVIGRLDPYTDPDCGCQLATTFTGSFRGTSTIEGTFESRGGEHHPLTRGTWKVTRAAR